MFQVASKIQLANIKIAKDIYQTTFSEENTKIISDLKLPLYQIKRHFSRSYKQASIRSFKRI